MWVAYLAPRLLRRYDEAVEPDGARFSDGMRVLRRRSVPRESGPVAAEPSITQTPEFAAGPGPVPPSAAARRRRVLVVLAALNAAGVVLVSAGSVAWWAAVPAPLCLAAYLVGLGVTGRRIPPSNPRVGRAGTAGPESLPTPVPAPRSALPVAQPSPRPARDEPVAEPDPAARRDARLVARRAVSHLTGAVASRAADDNTWEPLPVVLPTYVTKPKAVRAARVEGGGWASQAVVPAPPPRAVNE